MFSGSGRPRTLRQQILQAAVFLVVMLVVGILACVLVSTIPALRDQLRKQVTVYSFQELQFKDAEGLIDMAQSLSDNNALLDATRKDCRPMIEALDGLSTEQIRHPDEKTSQQLDQVRAGMTNLLEQAQQSFLKEDPYSFDTPVNWVRPRADLLVVADGQARVLFEVRSESNPMDLDHLKQIQVDIDHPQVQRPSTLEISDLGVVKSLLDPRAVGIVYYSYEKYPDGHIYLMVGFTANISNSTGLLLLGRRIDLRSAWLASRSSNDADAVIVQGPEAGPAGKYRFQDGYAPNATPPSLRPGPRLSERDQWKRCGSLTETTRRLGQDVQDYLNRHDRELGGWLPSGTGDPLGPRDEFPGAFFLAVESKEKAAKPEGAQMYDPSQRSLSLRIGNYLTMAYPLDEAPVPADFLTANRGLGKVLGWVLVMTPTSVLDQTALRQTLYVSLVGLAAVLLAWALTPLLAGFVTRPILELAERMTDVGEQTVLGRVEVEEVQPRGSTEIMQAGEAFNLMVRGLKQKQVLESFVTQETREEVAREGRLVLDKPQRVVATVLFSDLRGFTSLSERLDPDQLVELLGQYLSRMTEVILDNEGSIYEYIGDAILAVFKSQEGVDSAVLAVSAALAMYHALVDLQEETESQELRGLRMGIGLHTGELVDGNIGMEGRAKRAVIGDTVNLAARIQDRSRDGRHTCILVSESTHQRTEQKFGYEFFGEETFKGKSQPEKVWEVLA